MALQPKLVKDGQLADVPAVLELTMWGLPHVHRPHEFSPTCEASSPDTGLNMAETLAQSPLTIRAASQVSIKAQRLEKMGLSTNVDN